MPTAQRKPLRAVQPSVAAATTNQLEQTIADCHARAKDAAESGDISASARWILAALDNERRLAGRGPQVLQIIKPRG
ncbi:MAG: hypothetical protein FJ057_06910 [Cyanobacteria bacterium K_DeepCast_0m_m1_088]|nr:hypothetical protein [Cyanobacteria bacterium K_DeepCast_0m_m1_088]MBM5793654.1 hypothetical protein [Cyanobacteria bacterium K_DeepCast_0m_m1_088]